MSTGPGKRPSSASAKAYESLRDRAIHKLKDRGATFEEAEDIFAHKLKQILKKYPDATEDERQALVLKAVARGSIDAWRRKRTKQKHNGNLGRLAEGRQADFAEPDEIIGAKEQVEKLREALARLHPKDQEIIELRFFESLPWDEVGKKVNLSSAVVRKRWSRALPKLRRMLGQWDE